MKLEIKRHSQTRSDRVKGIDFHPTEPWLLTTLYSGVAQIWNYETQTVVKSIEVADVPLRAGRFIARKNWIIVGSDDFIVRVFNYNTGAKEAQFEAHPDYIRVITVHPTLPYVLTAGDDMSIRLWNWDSNWTMERQYLGHSHYIMYVAFNPKDTNTFASACLDRTVKVWSLSGASTVSRPNFTLEAHATAGVNFVEYYPGADKPYLITSSDDKTVKVWDYQTKACVATMEGHTNNVSFAVFHPDLPVIISGAEDNTVKVWNANTYQLEQTLNYSYERAWCVGVKRGSNLVAVGFDAGAVVLRLGKEDPAISLDGSGKLVWSKHGEVYSAQVKGEDAKDGESLALVPKELGSVEVFPTFLRHSPNGRFVAVVGDGEYIIYTALAWRNKAYGSGLDFVWAQDSSEYAVLESPSSVRVYKNFKERPLGHVDPNFSVEGIFGGTLLGVKGHGFVAMYSWETGQLVRRIDVEGVTGVHWSDSGELVAITSADAFYVLRYNKDAVDAAEEVDEDGVEESFELLHEISDSVRSGEWLLDCFVYTSAVNRLNYLVGGVTYTVAHFDKAKYLLGFVAKDSRIYLCDKDVHVSSYRLSVPLVEYQTVVLRGDVELAQSDFLPAIPEEELSKVAKFLEAQGFKELALEVSTDDEHKFDLALALNDLSVASEIAERSPQDHRWKLLGDAATAAWNFDLAEKCFKSSSIAEVESLLLLYSATGNKAGMEWVADKAADAGKYNVAFNALWSIGAVKQCVDLLNKTGRHSEAALVALSYGKGNVEKSVGQWKASLVASGKDKVAESISSPSEEPEKFPQGNLIDVDDKPAEPKHEEPKLGAPREIKEDDKVEAVTNVQPEEPNPEKTDELSETEAEAEVEVEVKMQEEVDEAANTF
ncbi:Coatomer subunit beta' [Yarrowia sp. B02]|nr:Coatomer subunit beta' [Yarrowia sp. B02]